MRKTGQPRLALEMILLRLARLQEVIPIDALLQKLEQLEQGPRRENTDFQLP